MYLDYHPDSPFILVGTKSEFYNEDDPNHVSKEEADALAKRLGAGKHIRCSSRLFCSSKETEGNVVRVFEEAVECAIRKSSYKSRKYLNQRSPIISHSTPKKRCLLM